MNFSTLTSATALPFIFAAVLLAILAISFAARAFVFCQPKPPSRSSVGSCPSALEYFWTRSSRSTGAKSFASSA